MRTREQLRNDQRFRSSPGRGEDKIIRIASQAASESSGGDVLVRLTAKAGSSGVYLYSGLEVEKTASPWALASFTTKAGGLTYSWTLANSCDMSGYGGPPLNADPTSGDIVLVKDLGDMGGIIVQNVQRGTY